MSAAAEPPYSEDWFRLAAEDLRRVSRRLAEEDTEDAAFHLQQAIEKCLKGYLLSRGWALKRIHNLEVLLDDAVRYDATLERYRKLCEQITGYYVIERYPTLEEGPTKREVTEAYTQAEAFIRYLRARRAKRHR
jgi:HEPN domain-containing protein